MKLTTHIARELGASSALQGFGCGTGDDIGMVVKGPAVLVTAIRENGGGKQ